MQLLLTIVVCLFAGAGAGLGTGFAGMSAAAVITPTKAGTRRVSWRAGDWMRATSCRKAVMPPKVSDPADMRIAAQAKATR